MNLVNSKAKIIKDLTSADLTSYVYQLTAYKIKRKNRIYIIAVTNDFLVADKSSWKFDPLIVCDGSSSAWGVSYDIQTKSLIDFSTNGPLITARKKL